MRLPSILLIGAMKSGTTSLYLDLARHQQVYLADDKEPHALCSDAVLSDAGRRKYAALYAGTRDGQLLCDASTGYSKRPDFEGVAERASEVLAPDFKVIYMVRHPIERILSQHHHEFTEGLVGPDVAQAVRDNRRYVAYSSYAYQLEPWLRVCGADRVRVVQFERYVADRDAVVRELIEFLGLPDDGSLHAPAPAANRSSNKPVRNRFWDVVYHHPLYRGGIRRLIPFRLRARFMRMALPKATERRVEPLPAALEWLYVELQDDVRRLQQLLSSNAPHWPDFDARSASPPVVPPSKS